MLIKLINSGLILLLAACISSTHVFAQVDKGFTGEVYAAKIKKHFKDATGVEVSEDDASSTDPTKKAWEFCLSLQKP